MMDTGTSTGDITGHNKVWGLERLAMNNIDDD